MGKKNINYIWTDKKRTLFGLPLSFTRYYLTEKKLITSIGLLNITEYEIDLYKITDKQLKLPFLQRLFKCGSVIVFAKSADTAQGEVKSVKRPREFHKLLDENICLQRDKYRIRGRDMFGDMGSAE